MNISGIVSSLSMNIKPFMSSINTATKEASRFSKKLQNDMNKSAGGADKVTQGTKSMASGFKDVSRIVQGIAVSKTIYSILGAVQDATQAVWEFSSNLEYADMVYTNLFGDTELADTFIATLKEVAAVSPFNFQDIEKATKRLKAYGLETQNLLYVTQGVLAASTAQGSSNAIESISRALGQIYTKGTLKAEEARQLAEAGIPVYEILQDKLKLTQEQLANLADQAIPANRAINALVDGINERFGSLLEDSANTMQGIMSNIQDNLLMIGSDAIEPLFVQIKALFSALGDDLVELRKLTAKGGLGALFENVIPKSLQTGVKDLVANVVLLASGLKQIALGMAQAFMGVLPTLLGGLNALLSVLSNIFYFVGAVVKRIRENEAVMKLLITALSVAAVAWTVWKAKALAALAVAALAKVFYAITKAVNTLAAALWVLAEHPVWIFLLVAGGIVLALSAKFGLLSNAITRVRNAIASLSGLKPSGLFKSSNTDEASSSLDDFNKKLDDSSSGLGDVTDAAKKAANAAKGLLAFDEVFSLQKQTGTDTTALDDLTDSLEDVDLGGLGDMDWANILPSTDGIKTWGQGIIDSLLDALNPETIGALIGAALGAALGWLVGGPLGALIGAGLGAIAGFLWTKLAEELGLTDTEKLGIPIGAAIGAAVGGLIGGPFGAIIGAAIGALVGWIAALLYDGFVNGNWQETKLSMLLGTALGAAIGFVVGGPAGAAIGAAIGTLVGYVGGLLIDGFTKGDWDFKGLGISIGTGIGAAIGLVLGGPMGAVIGAAAGALVGGVIGIITENFTSGEWSLDLITEHLGTAISTAIGAATRGIPGAAINLATGALVEWIGSKLRTQWPNVTKNLPDISGPLSTGLINSKTKIVTAVNAIIKIFTDMGESISTKFTEVRDAVIERVNEILSPVVAVITEIWNIVSTVGTDIFTAVTTVLTDISTAISTVSSAIYGVVSSFLELIQLIIIWAFEQIKNAVAVPMQYIQTFITTVLTFISNLFKTIFTAVFTVVKTIMTQVQATITSIWNTIKDFFTETFGGIITDTTDSFTTIYDTIKEKIGNMYDTVTEGVANIYQVFKDWITDMWNNVFKKLFEWLDDAIEKLKEFFRLKDKAGSSSSSSSTTSGGHANGGIFNREHYAKFAEGNKAEAIIPLENNTAMQPFVDAVANGLTSSMGPILASLTSTNENAGTNQLRPLYVGTLIADERSLKELNKKMQIIEIQENQRRGL